MCCCRLSLVHLLDALTLHRIRPLCNAHDRAIQRGC